MNNACLLFNIQDILTFVFSKHCFGLKKGAFKRNLFLKKANMEPNEFDRTETCLLNNVQLNDS